MSETYPGQMLPELQEKTTVDSNDLFYMVSSNASKKIKGSNLKAQMKPSDYTGATSSTNGANGLVPQPTTSDVDRFLKGDGTWGDISYAVGEASGSIATFSDGSPLPMRSLKAHIEPVQDLHGYVEPWVGGAGKNKAQPVITTNTTLGGIAFNPIKDNDGNVLGLSVGNGTVNADINQHIAEFSCSESGTYKIIGAKLNGSLSVNKRVLLWDNTSQTTTVTIIDNNEVSVSLTAEHEYSLTINIRSSVTVDASELRFMICKDSESSTFAPYSNICPISGWSEVNVTRTGKNFLFCTRDVGERSAGGGTITTYADGTIKISGNFTSTITITYSDSVKLKSGNYKLNGGGSGYSITLSGIGSVYNDSDYSFSIAEDYNGSLSIYISTGQKNVTIKPMIRLSTETDSTYEPFGTIYTIQFTDGSNPLTVYGGYVDVVSGLLVVNRTMVDMGTLTWGGQGNPNTFQAIISDMLTPSNNIMCSQYKTVNATTSAGNMPDSSIKTYGNSTAKYIIVKDSRYSDASTFETAMNGVQAVYELATPQTIQLTPTQVKSLLGANNVWADTGDVDVHYVRDLTITIDDILSRLEDLEG